MGVKSSKHENFIIKNNLNNINVTGNTSENIISIFTFLKGEINSLSIIRLQFIVELIGSANTGNLNIKAYLSTAPTLTGNYYTIMQNQIAYTASNQIGSHIRHLNIVGGNVISYINTTNAYHDYAIGNTTSSSINTNIDNFLIITASNTNSLNSMNILDSTVTIINEYSDQ